MKRILRIGKNIPMNLYLLERIGEEAQKACKYLLHEGKTGEDRWCKINIGDL